MAGLYVHIPFCHSKCAYCDFYSVSNRNDESRLVDALLNEYRLRSTEISQPIDTIYIGGGTPSILSDESLVSLINGLKEEIATRYPGREPEFSEFTVEVNPEDVTPCKTALLRSLGVDRVSMGIQSFVDSELSIIGRRHTAAEAVAAVDTLRDGGFSNISLDLIYGLPGQTIDSWRYSLDRMMEISPSHFSAYILSYEPKTRLTAMLKTGKITAASDDLISEMYRELAMTAAECGYVHYEISNFCKPGCRALHNSSYWDGTHYIGLGPSAHSFDGKTRRANPANLKEYLSKLEHDQYAYNEEKENRYDKFNDLIVTGLRTIDGVSMQDMGIGRRRQFLCDVFPYLRSGKVILRDGRFCIPEQEWLVSDAIMRDLMQG